MSLCRKVRHCVNRNASVCGDGEVCVRVDLYVWMCVCILFYGFCYQLYCLIRTNLIKINNYLNFSYV